MPTTHAARSERRATAWLVLGSLLFAVGLLELGVRTYAWAIGRGFWENPHEFISPFFTTDGWPAPWRDAGTLVFKEGERLTVPKPPRQLRVVCLGGSTTLPSTDAEGVSYPRALERLLRDRFPGRDIVVANAGENGYSSAHSLVNLALRVLEADPDVVAIYHNINDLSVNYFGAGAEPDYANKYLTTYYLGLRHRPGMLGRIDRMSRLASIIENRIEMRRWGYGDYDETRDWHPGLPIFQRNLRSLVGIARVQQVGIVLGTQAARTNRRTAAGFMAYNGAIREVARTLNVPLAEVAEVVTDDRLFLDDVHNTSAGERLVAQQFLAPVAEMLAARVAAAP